MIAGLEDRTDGVIESHGQVSVSEPDSDRSLIFQESSLYPWLSVADNVTFGLKLRGVSKEERRQVADELLQEVGSAALGTSVPDELSGGMRQRAAVARALAMKPSILLMDEPFAALDVQTRAKLQDFLIKIWRDSGASVLFVTHHIDEALALADRVVVFTARPGRIKSILPIDMPRPRDPRDPQFHKLRDHLIDLLADEVDRAFAEQEGISDKEKIRGLKREGRSVMASSLIRGRYVICRALSRTEAEIIEDGAVFQRDGRIVEIGPYEELSARHRPDEELGSPDHVVLPGFVNSHHHVGLTPLQLGSKDHALELWFATRLCARKVDRYLDTLYSAFE